MTTDRRTGRPPLQHNTPGERTPQRQVRIPNEDWYGAAAKAQAEGITASEAIRRLLAAWVAGDIELP